MANTTNTKLDKELFEQAFKVQKKAYSPYSKFQVGAALVDDQGQIHVGCNVENSSFGGTICAERAAITAMVSQGGKSFNKIVIVTSTPQGTPPCGICRQVLAEFCKDPKKTEILIATPKGITQNFKFNELLPEAFNSSFLKKLS